MAFTEKEIEEFVKENRKLIEKLMEIQKSGATDAAAAGRKAAHDAKDEMEKAKKKADDFAKQTIGLLSDPEVQRHFMAMGMEFIAGMSVLMSKAPIPDSFKNMASTAGTSWQGEACARNGNCGAAQKMTKVDIVTKPAPKKAAASGQKKSTAKPKTASKKGKTDAGTASE